MLGNFLTTLGNTPEEDRAMFEEFGLNVARQADNGANPRPDNRAGWLAGETPDLVTETLDAPPQAAPPALEVRLWDPSSQLRFRAKRERAAATRRRPQHRPRPRRRPERR